MTGQTCSILVVDDDADTCENLRDILTDQGYEVRTANGAAAALQLVRQNPFDVALLDLKMPEMDGVSLYREIKKLSSSTVAIIVTAYASHDTEQEAHTAGTWKVLAKPVDLARLLPLVREAAQQPLVMVVDDDHEICENLWDLLRESGYRVGVAHSVQEAENRLAQKKYQVVLVDMRLPEGDGYDVFRAVQRTNPEARTVLITGHRLEMDQIVRQVLAEGADAVCYKPFDVARLLETLRELAGGREGHGENLT